MKTAISTITLLFLLALFLHASIDSNPPWPAPNSAPVDNWIPISGELYSGGEPLEEADFRWLQEQGIRTIVSVDGLRPNVDAARKYGLRYVHIPIGYDSIGTKSQWLLARLAAEGAKPIFIHCHHGKHRGPAAAALCAQYLGVYSQAQAKDYLQEAGTSPKYVGLWRDALDMKPIPADGALPPLEEIAQVDSLAQTMAGLDRTFDLLADCAESGWNTPAEHPDIVPRLQATLLVEGLREATRHIISPSAELKAAFDRSIEEAQELETALQRDDRHRAMQILAQIEASCQNCHAQHRN